jgi:hypothetical protein
VNKAWHDANVMPKKATLEQRIEWHLEHQKQCGCRPVPDSVKRAIEIRAG